jgi:asparagine synthase (glutamine-hydrolysing)
LRCPGIGHEIDIRALLSFLLYFQPIRGDQTPLRDIHILAPGEELAIDNSGVHRRHWWNSEFHSVEQKTFQDEADARGRLRCLLQQSVLRQMNADVPVGVCLSGGLDSTILAALFAQATREKPPTYTICLEGDEEEADFAHVVASHLGTRHKNFIITADEYFRGMQELIYLRKFPCVVPNEPLIYLLAKRMAPEVKVALTGEGADELFGGYTRLLSAVEARETAGSDEEEKKWALLTSMYHWFSKEELLPLLAPQTAQMLNDWNLESPLAEFSKKHGQYSALDRAFLLLEHFHLPGLLGRLDGAMMAASVEGRVPYTDNDLVEFVLHLSSTVKYKGSLRPDKHLLRKTFEDLVPAPILRRPKKAFPVPLEGLFQTAAGIAARKRILECEPLYYYMNREALMKWMENGHGLGFALQVWKFLSVALFLESNLSSAVLQNHHIRERKNSSPSGTRPIEQLNQWDEISVLPSLIGNEGLQNHKLPFSEEDDQ